MKTITLEKEIHKKLFELRLNLDFRSMNEVIAYLLELKHKYEILNNKELNNKA